MRTGDLIGLPLNWAVAKCEGEAEQAVTKGYVTARGKPAGKYAPLSDWAQGGPIIEREKIDVKYTSAGSWHAAIEWLDEPSYTATGPTALIAAMRCYIISKLGPEVEIPEYLLP